MALFRRRQPDAAARPWCEVHDTARVMVPHFRDPVEVLDLGATVARLLEREAAGTMRLLRGDCPTAELLALAADEALYTFALVHECGRCGALMKLAVAVRSSYPLWDEISRDQLEAILFHDWDHLVDELPGEPIRLQSA